MNRDYSQKNIDELCRFLDEASMGDVTIEKIKAILASKTIRYLAGSIDVAKEAISLEMEKLDKSINRLSASSNMMFVATVVYSVVMLLLTGAIALSALAQAGLMKFK